MEQTHDYYTEVLAYAESLNKSANEDWTRAILDGAPRPLPASEVLSIAEWIETEGPDAWTTPEAELDAIAAGLRAIVAQ